MIASLPVNDIIPQLTDDLSQNYSAILQAPPGAGKTTCVPLALYQLPWLEGRKLLMLEPRRLAARTAAHQMASLLGEDVGDTVGYRIRLDSKISRRTRIEVVTEGVLLRLLQDDPSLEAYGMVIFDEFHERSLDSDLGLAMLLYARDLFREADPLRILLMSATLEDSRLGQLMPDAGLIQSNGRQYPVTLHYADRPLEQFSFIADVSHYLQQVIREQTGSVLVFLPGQPEIRRLAEQLDERHRNDSGIHINPLYGELSLEQQQQAISPAPPGQRKIVLATNIAETSLTIEGIRVVVDTGFCREPRFDASTALTRLHTTRISAASATQRAGRAGRLEPGACYRLWTESQQDGLTPFSTPEILQADLAPMLLQLASWGINDPRQLIWLDPPPRGSCEQARTLLQQLEALDETGNITALGEAMARLPTHPRLAHLLLSVTNKEALLQACNIAALLAERDPLQNASADIELRLEWLQRKPGQQQGMWHRLQQQSAQFSRLCRDQQTETGRLSQPGANDLGLMLALAYPDRIARQRRKGSIEYQLSNGRAVQLSEDDPLRNQPWLAVATTRGHAGSRHDLISLAAALDIEQLAAFLPHWITDQQQVFWDEQNNKISAEQIRQIGQLILSRSVINNPDPEQINRVLLQQIARRGLNCLPWTRELQQWRERVCFLHRLAQSGNSTVAGQSWPDLSDDTLINTLNDWLAPFLQGPRRFDQISSQALQSALHSLLPWPLPDALSRLAPEKIQVPSGSRIRVDYSHEPPVLAVKLQELFGWKTGPMVAGNIPLQLHLLSPAQRPVQITSDLAGFWQTTYAEVKKDMKGRYPKHHWPDDPITATASRGVKRRPSG